MTQNPLENLTDEQKASLKFAKNLAISRVVYGIVRVTLVHAIGRKIAPKVFTSFGRTYGVVVLANLLKATPSLSEDAKEKLKAVQKLIDDRSKGYGDHDDVVKG